MPVRAHHHDEVGAGVCGVPPRRTAGPRAPGRRCAAPARPPVSRRRSARCRRLGVAGVGQREARASTYASAVAITTSSADDHELQREDLARDRGPRRRTPTCHALLRSSAPDSSTAPRRAAPRVIARHELNEHKGDPGHSLADSEPVRPPSRRSPGGSRVQLSIPAVAPVTAARPASGTPKRDRTHYLYIAVIVAVVPRHRVGLRRPRLRGEAQAARHGVRRPDQDDDQPDHLLHHRAGRRLGRQRGQGRQGRRPGARLLPDDVDLRARHRPRRRQPHPARRRAQPHRASRPRPAPAQVGARPGPTTDFLLGIIPTSLFSALTDGEVLQTLLVALLVGFALQAHGQGRRAGAARRRAPPAAGLPGARR